MAAAGLEFPPDSPGISHAPEEALHRALHDGGLARVVAAWPGLPAHVKAAVLALVEAAG